MAWMLTLALLGIGSVQGGPPALPDPRIFVRAEDRERARRLMTPCSEADAGRGCSRHAGRLYRDSPCSYHIDADTLGSLPTDRCYRMDAPRRYRGVWVDEFEGQRFISEGAETPERPRTEPGSPGWKAQVERARLATIWFDTGRVDVPRTAPRTVRRWLIEFVGRKTRYPGAYGHFGSSVHAIIADRVISLRECSPANACG